MFLLLPRRHLWFVFPQHHGVVLLVAAALQHGLICHGIVAWSVFCCCRVVAWSVFVVVTCFSSLFWCCGVAAWFVLCSCDICFLVVACFLLWQHCAVVLFFCSVVLWHCHFFVVALFVVFDAALLFGIVPVAVCFLLPLFLTTAVVLIVIVEIIIINLDVIKPKKPN